MINHLFCFLKNDQASDDTFHYTADNPLVFTELDSSVDLLTKQFKNSL